MRTAMPAGPGSSRRDTAMNDAIQPSDEEDVAAIVADLASRKVPISIAGGGTRAGLGRPIQTATAMNTGHLAGITLYEPTELVLSARAGTPLSTVENLLAEHGQRLPFEPPDYRSLYGSEGEPTIGAVAAANLSGPRRIMAGAARDSLIGLRVVTGRGEIVKSGGRVMKNVTGYDLVKFLSGSYGTLGILTEVTFKVLPVPETEATLVLAGLDDRKAIAALTAALGSPYSVTGAAHLHAIEGKSRTLLRIDGFERSVADRAARLQTLLARFGSVDVLPRGMSETVWHAVRDLDALAAERSTPIWRLSVKPSEAPDIAETIGRSLECRILYDWGGGLIWLAGGKGADAGATIIREAVGARGGHATLVRAPDNVRNVVEVFEPPAPAVMTLTRKLKESFDPAGILNPGRMYAGV